MNELLFNFEGKEVEVINFNGQPLFNPRDVGECLDISYRTVAHHISSLNEKQVIKLTNDLISDLNLTGIRQMHTTGENFLTESGVYQLVMISRKPSAQRFRDWITDVVLPRISQFGVFIPGNTPEQIVQNGMIGMELMVPADQYNKLVGEHLEQRQQLLDLKNKIYFDRLKNLMIRKDIYDASELYSYVYNIHDYGNMTDEEFEKILVNLGFLGMDCRGRYTLINPEKVVSLDPLSFTYKGFVELCYAIDNRSDLYYKVR